MTLLAQPVNCTLKSDVSSRSSTDAMIDLIAKELRAFDVEVADTIRGGL